MDSEDTASTRENPRTRRARELMLSTAIDLLMNHGAQEVTAARVAEEAGVARTTVYRQWPDQRSLLLATISTVTIPHHVTVYDGPVDHDVRAALDALRFRLVHRDVRSLFGALAAHSSHDEAFSDAQRHFVRQLTRQTVDALEAGRQRGELDAQTDCLFEADLLAAPILHCHLVLHEEVPDSLVDEALRRWRASLGIR